MKIYVNWNYFLHSIKMNGIDHCTNLVHLILLDLETATIHKYKTAHLIL